MTDVPQEIRDYIDEKFNELEEDQDTKRMIVEVALTDALSLAFGQLIAKSVCSAHELDRIFEQFEDGIRQDHKGDTEEERFIRECGVRILQLLRNRIELAALGKNLGRTQDSGARH